MPAPLPAEFLNIEQLEMDRVERPELVSLETPPPEFSNIEQLEMERVACPEEGLKLEMPLPEFLNIEQLEIERVAYPEKGLKLEMPLLEFLNIEQLEIERVAYPDDVVVLEMPPPEPFSNIEQFIRLKTPKLRILLPLAFVVLLLVFPPVMARLLNVTGRKLRTAPTESVEGVSSSESVVKR